MSKLSAQLCLKTPLYCSKILTNHIIKYKVSKFLKKKNPDSRTAEFFFIIQIKALGFFGDYGFVLL
jgi:hypothetical protein